MIMMVPDDDSGDDDDDDSDHDGGDSDENGDDSDDNDDCLHAPDETCIEQHESWEDERC